MLFFLLCVTLSFAEFTWVEEIEDDAITLYNQDIDDVDNYNRTGYTYDYYIPWGSDYMNQITLNEDFPFSKLIINNTVPHENEESESTYFIIKYIANLPNLESFQFMNYYSNAHLLYYSEYMYEMIQVLLGCFDSQTGCFSGLSGDWSSFYLYRAPISIISDDVDHDILTIFKTIFTNPFSYIYVYIDGIASQTITFKFGELTNDRIAPFSKSYYLFTVPTKHNYFQFLDSTWYVKTNYKAGNICTRKDTVRYVLFKEFQKPYTNCSCWTRYNDTSITIDSKFNYPDCKYNSTMFDLVLPYSSTVFSLSDDLLEWYSIIFRTSRQSVQINDGKTLTIDELDLNQDKISFNENVYVKNLTVSIIGASFNVLDFDYINYNSNYSTTALFSINSTSTNLENLDLKLCSNNIFISSKRLFCNYKNNEYLNENDEIDSFCDEMKQTYCNILIIQSNEYVTVSVEKWYSLSFGDLAVTLYGSFTLHSDTCYFENKTITINGELYCTTTYMNSNTKLIINGNLITGTLVFSGEIDNLNQNGLIELYGNIQIQTLSIESTQSNCFEFISSNVILPIPQVSNDHSLLSLSQDHLLRICPIGNLNYDVQCTITGNTFDYTSFDSVHCPCNGENCIINVDNNKINSLLNEFDGTFNIQTNSTIAISYKTSSFNIIFDESNQVIILGSGAVGFTLTNTTSINSVSNTYTITTSNQFSCKAYLIQFDQYICLLEDDREYPLLNSIENCQSYNGFGCEVCYEGYESNITYCSKCPNNCIRCFESNCLNCKTNYYLNTEGICEEINDPYIVTFDNNKVMQCNETFYSDTTSCNECLFDDCMSCNSTQCLICDQEFILNNGNCEIIDETKGEEIVSNYGAIDCGNTFYVNDSQCKTCTDIDESCNICNVNGCLSCNGEMEFIDENGKCSIDNECNLVVNSKCLSCNDKGSWFNGNVCEQCCENCKFCINSKCIECNDGYNLQSENSCVYNGNIDNCVDINSHGLCSRCGDEYYLEDNLCYKCPSECSKCYNSDFCLKCKDGYMLDDNQCVDMAVINTNCKTAIPGSSGACAICDNGYYRDLTSCYPCISNCSKCNNLDTCIVCDTDYFLFGNAKKCISYDELTNCESKTKSGCSKCLDGYYLNNQYCNSCESRTENCNTCKSNGDCSTCQNDYVLINYECIHYQLIDSCKKSEDSKCSKCAFWHTPNSAGTGCDTQAEWWVIVLSILFVLVVFICITMLIWYLIKQIFKYAQKEKTRKTATIFDMARSNVVFNQTNNPNIVVNKETVTFIDNDEYEEDEKQEIAVNEETRDLLCVGNDGKNTIKVQFSVKQGCDKYEIRTFPQVVLIKKGKACEFEIFIKPLCTCGIDDQIMLVSTDLKKDKTITTTIKINATTVMTTRLDYEELVEEDKLGEGSFGIVYKGTFRGHAVAIKKMKNANDDPEAVEEFEKEVQMLDKFRSEYIVHFYGAVFIPTKICMVTEFAPYGSLLNLIKKKRHPIDPKIRLIIMSNCAKGIKYLHSNGILHRDIKPDNVLVTSLDKTEKVNAKLTDFGSSRNINMMMTNMTFTKGIGTPVFMAPEVLKQNKYKKAADIFSFGVSLYETMVWGEAYPKEQFRYPWLIAELISNGDRLPKPDNMKDEIYDLISNCWAHEPKERYDIIDVVETIEELI